MRTILFWAPEILPCTLFVGINHMTAICDARLIYGRGGFHGYLYAVQLLTVCASQSQYAAMFYLILGASSDIGTLHVLPPGI